MTEAASVYGASLYDLARDEGKSDVMLSQLRTLDACFEQNADFLRLLCTPDLPKAERVAILDRCFAGKIDGYLLNFLKILTERGHIRQFSGCVRAFRALYNDDHGIMPVTVVTAVPMTDGQKARLCQKLSQITGKRIELTHKIDPSCIGGVCLDYDGKRVDDTIVYRLDTVSQLLKNTIL